MKGIGTPENKEKAFQIYREFGGRNVPKILRELKTRHGIGIRTSTFYEWKRDGNWDERMKRADAEKEDVEYESLSFPEKMFRDLLKRKEAYEQYFRGLAPDRMDNHAQYAYNHILKTLAELADKVKPEEAADPEKMKQVMKEILEREYGIG